MTNYLFHRSKGTSSFWHIQPKVNDSINIGKLGNYYFDYKSKTEYPGSFDKDGVPMLNYFGEIGSQYNPDSIAQYALGHFELFLTNGDAIHKNIFLSQADWFVENIKERDRGIGVWEYKFDWEYYQKLHNPWYTSLGQGHGISVLLRAYYLVDEKNYLEAAKKAFLSYKHSIDVDGGIKYIDENGYIWFEEAIIKPCTHILNGFIWSLWGLYDYWLALNDDEALVLFNDGINTLENNLHRYDNGFWTTYDLASTRLPGIASHYYHRLHISQLKVLYLLTGKEVFNIYADKWAGYEKKFLNRWLAYVWKVGFKLFYY